MTAVRWSGFGVCPSMGRLWVMTLVTFALKPSLPDEAPGATLTPPAE